MPQQDAYHKQVRNALKKDGWIVTHDPFTIRLEDIKFYVDLAAGKNSWKQRRNEEAPDEITFYEVKLDASASVCIKNALGQILWYAFIDNDKRRKKIVVVGQYAATAQERLFIKFLQQNLKLEFEYQHIDYLSSDLEHNL